MALVAKTLTLDITPGAIPQVVKVSEYDQNRQYTVTLVDEGGVFEIPSDTTATVEGTIGGSGFSANATISGDTITFTLTESMTAKAGDVWCKIKLVKDSKPIQTCAFILRCDKAGVEADTVIGAPGFQEQINEGVAEYFDNDPPFFELPSGGQSGQALLSDGNDGAVWGSAQSGTGITEDLKTALMNVASHIGVWTDDQGSVYVQALHDALYPPANLSFITASFNQGGAVIYNTDSLNVLKQYLTVVAHYDNQTTQTVTSYTLSGTLTVGTSVITVSYGGKTTTFNVTVTKATTDLVFTVGGSDPSTDADTTSTTRYKSARIPVNSSGDTSYEFSADITVDGAKGWFVLRSYDANGNYLGPFETSDSIPNSYGYSSGGWAKTDGTSYQIVKVNKDASKVAQTRFIRIIIRNNQNGNSGSTISTFSGTVTTGGKTYDVVQQ